MKKSRIIDIALQSGVSTATVDRVINNRPGVRQKTIDKVLEAIRTLDESASRPKIIRTVENTLTVDAVISGGAGFANDVLAKELHEAARMLGIRLRIEYPHRLNPTAMAEALQRCLDRGTSGIIVQALDHPMVRSVIEEASEAGVSIVSMLTSLPGVRNIGYVGLDNRAAGRTAGLLMGLFARERGEIAIFVGGPLYRSHEEREMGFRTLLREEHRHLSILPVAKSNDDPQRCYEMTMELMVSNPDLRGILNIGGGNRGIERAILELKKMKDIVFICFNLTPLTRQALVSGVLNAVVHQNMGKAAHIALQSIIDGQSSVPMTFSHVPVEIIMQENI